MGTNFYFRALNYSEPEMNFKVHSLEEMLEGYKPGPLVDCDFESAPRTCGKHIGKRSGAGAYCFKCDVTLCKAGKGGVHYSGKEWFAACPKCGAKKDEKDSPVKYACSWSWAVTRVECRIWCEAHYNEFCVSDEYEKPYTGKQFLEEELAYCKIVYTNSIGTEFS